MRLVTVHERETYIFSSPVLKSFYEHYYILGIYLHNRYHMHLLKGCKVQRLQYNLFVPCGLTSYHAASQMYLAILR